MTDPSARLAPGDPAPDFTLPDADGKPVSLRDYRGRKVVVYFYPAAMTTGCTKQACDFRDNLADLGGAGFDVLGISPDQPAKLAKFRDAEGLTFPLLSDPDRLVLTAWGAYGEKTSVRQEDGRGDPVHLRGGRGGHDRAGPLQRQGDRPRRLPPQEALRLTRPARRHGAVGDPAGGLRCVSAARVPTGDGRIST